MIYSSQGGSLVPRRQQGLGLVSASWASHPAPSLRTKHLCLICPQASPPDALLVLLPDPLLRAWNPLLVGPNIHWQAFLIPAFLDAWSLSRGHLLCGQPSPGLFTMASVSWNGELPISCPLNTVLCSLAGTRSVSTPSLVSFPYLATPVNGAISSF